MKIKFFYSFANMFSSLLTISTIIEVLKKGGKKERERESLEQSSYITES